MYEVHNLGERGEGFSILKGERGALFKKEIGTGKEVLDLGCRDGALTTFFAEGNKVVGADIDTVALAKAAALGVETVQLDLNGDWHELTERKFGAVVLAETLEHVYYPEKVLAKVAKHLTPDGLFVGSVPNAFSLKNRIRLFLAQKQHTPLADPTHINHFAHHELKKLLQHYFSEVAIVPLGSYATYDSIWPGMLSFDLAWVCKKPIPTAKS